jgi:hypothetical protein
VQKTFWLSEQKLMPKSVRESIRDIQIVRRWWRRASWQADVAEHVGRIEVCATTLDDWCAAEVPAADLVIKIEADIQGAEGRMIAGGRQVFADRRIAAFYSEVHFAPTYEGQASFWDLHETRTEEHGLALWQIYELARDVTGRATWSDALWLRDDGLASMWP